VGWVQKISRLDRAVAVDIAIVVVFAIIIDAVDVFAIIIDAVIVFAIIIDAVDAVTIDDASRKD
jgi:hypothetical protein